MPAHRLLRLDAEKPGTGAVERQHLAPRADDQQPVGKLVVGGRGHRRILAHRTGDLQRGLTHLTHLRAAQTACPPSSIVPHSLRCVALSRVQADTYRHTVAAIATFNDSADP